MGLNIEEIKLANVVLANFMGWEEIYEGANQFAYNKPKGDDTIYYRRDLRGLQYHVDWNWLMPVLHKIEQIRLNSSITNEEVDYRKDVIDNKVIQVDIQQTYTCIVDFVKWYNKTKILT